MEKLGMAPLEEPEDVEKRLQREKIEDENSIERGAEWVLGTLEREPQYGERIPLKPDRTFDIPQNVTELPGNASQLARSAYRMEYSQKGLYDLAREISQRHPELRFSFKTDPKGRWVEDSVQKEQLNIGDEVLWENQGVLQWKEPKKIKSIHEDPRSKRKYAFVEGSATGIPLDELTRS